MPALTLSFTRLLDRFARPAPCLMRTTARSLSGRRGRCCKQTGAASILISLYRCQMPLTCGRPTARTHLQALSLDDLDMPEIDGDIHSIQIDLGALFNDDGIAYSFSNKKQALEALESGVVLVDRSHWGRIRLSGEDRLSFMHNQSTNSFKDLKPGQGAETVFVSATGRCVDLATALVSEKSVLLITSPSSRETLLQRFDKYLFPGDKVQVQDISAKTVMITLAGPEAEVMLKELAGDALKVFGSPQGTHQIVGFQNAPIIIVSGSGLAAPGYTLIIDETIASDVYAIFSGKGAIPMGEDDWNIARVLAGRPAPGSELTDAYNPLEAGLYHAVSLNKGCYLGQETLAKLHTRDGVRQQLWGLQLNGPTAPGAEITSELTKVGIVTSTCQDALGNWVGLGYIRCRVGGAQIDLEGVRVAVAGEPATVTAIPFASRAFSAENEPQSTSSSSSSTPSSTIQQRAGEAKQKKLEQKSNEDLAKQERLKAMQERLAAWQAQQ